METFPLLMVPTAPLLAALAILFLRGRATGAAAMINMAGLTASLLALLLSGNTDVRVETVWMEAGSLQLTAGLQLDGLSRLMGLLVVGIALVVGWYSAGYMAEEKSGFFALLSFFSGAMLTLVLASSFLILFAGWEAVGVASFLLIAWHHREPAARRAAMQALLITRLGDLALLLGWLLALTMTGSTSMEGFLAAAGTGMIAPATLSLIALLFLIGAMGKSAQLPLSIWLPNAMVAPSPVSALIHSATMVAAGVYLLLRTWPLFEAAPAVLQLVMWIGGITALISALAATAAKDLKRILAWSTSSQLGEMFLAIGLGGPMAAGFHLTMHAIFKSALFLCAGTVEHLTGSRELGARGGLARLMPVTALVFAAAALAQAGIWPFAGSWSEHAILAEAVEKSWLAGGFVLLLIFLAGIYIGRAGAGIFLASGQPREVRRIRGSMGGAMIVLGLGSIFAGWGLERVIHEALPFASRPQISTVWKAGSVLAGLLGIGFGVWRVRSAGPVPALNARFDWLPDTLEALSNAGARGSVAISHALQPLERSLGRLADSIGKGFPVAGRRVAGFDHGLDGVARVMKTETFSLARLTTSLEKGGFTRGLDALAGSLGGAGSQLRRTESGKLYLYTFGLFLWATIVGLISLRYWH